MQPTLIAGDESLYKFCTEIFQIEDPVIAIWVSENYPDTKKIEKLQTGHNKIGLDFVRFFIKEHFHSLFFPAGFKKNKWNLVIAGVKEDAGIIQPTANGLLKGWIMGTDIEAMTVDIDVI